jgi:transposase
LLSFKFCLYPTKEQELALEQTLDGCRWVYNYFLSISPMSKFDMNYALTELKKSHPWLRNYHSNMRQMVGKQIAAARKVANLTKNHGLARRILDASWSTFKTMCQYKANRVVEVEPAYSSINCSRCSHPVPKSLAVRTHSCPKCMAMLDRDYNSALNHLRNSLQLLHLPAERRRHASGDCNAVGEAGSRSPLQ